MLNLTIVLSHKYKYMQKCNSSKCPTEHLGVYSHAPAIWHMLNATHCPAAIEQSREILEVQTLFGNSVMRGP
jgi:hypothetical protein